MSTKMTEISALVNDMLDKAVDHMRAKAERALQSGAIDPESWDPEVNPMILPKIILIAVLETEADQYKAKGTSFEREVSKSYKNLKLFI